MAGAAERLADLLRVGNKTKGFKKAVLNGDGSLNHYARQMIEVMADDIVEVCKSVQPKPDTPPDKIVAALLKGSSPHVTTDDRPGLQVTILADDLFHLLEQAAPQA